MDEPEDDDERRTLTILEFLVGRIFIPLRIFVSKFSIGFRKIGIFEEDGNGTFLSCFVPKMSQLIFFLPLFYLKEAHLPSSQ